MTEVILHHYKTSPFGAVIRLALGLKNIAWKSVEAPMVSPKPDLSALTGGYERIPVLQVGANIYCDTAMIVDKLEAHKPEPSLYPQPMGFGARLIAQWSGSQWFMPAVGAALGTNPDVVSAEFWEDRRKRFGMNTKTFLPAVPHMTSQFQSGADLLAEALADGRAFIGGAAAGHADFALYANVQFVGFGGIQPKDLGPNIASWFNRVQAIGFGEFETWTAEQAIAHASENEPVGAYEVLDSQGFEEGDQVSVKTESPDPASVVGKLIGLDNRKIVLEREDERAGNVHVHLPRLGQILSPA